MEKKRKQYFKGWYIKIQNGNTGLALIPGICMTAKGRGKAFIQVFYENKTYFIRYPLDQVWMLPNGFGMRIGENIFTKDGMKIRIQSGKLELSGHFTFYDFRKPAYPIMGPLTLLAKQMECNHRIVSMAHRVDGVLKAAGRKQTIKDGIGYIEGDSGCRFPREYLWIHTFENPKYSAFGRNRSITAAIADIPVGRMSFRGCFALISNGKQEIRLASYKGARVLYRDEKGFAIAQGKYLLCGRIPDSGQGAQTLMAPDTNGMGRKIRENLSGSVELDLFIHGRRVLSSLYPKASYELEMR